MKFKLPILSIIFYSSFCIAGKIEIKAGNEIKFYEGNGTWISLDTNVKCKGTARAKKYTILSLVCQVNGNEIGTRAGCDPVNGFGFASLDIETSQGKLFDVTHHCNGLSIE